MPKIINIRFAALLLLLTVTCERDDICAEGTSTTPRLLLEFYDITNPEELKNVVRLTAYGEGLITEDGGPTAASDATLVFNSNSDNLALPLLIEAEDELSTTRFILEKETNLRLDDNPESTSNVDILEISYFPKFEYVSRACGYKSIFRNVEVRREDDADNWIIDINVLVLNVENENEVHVQIFH
jgi:hypothetical protein